MPRMTVRTELPGQDTLTGSWTALGLLSSGARLHHARTSLAAVFPAWLPLNNALLLDPPTSRSASAAAVELEAIYARAGVAQWALWLPNPALDFESPDEVTSVEGMTRDTSTLVMRCELSEGPRFDGQVLRTTVEAAGRAGEEPVPVDQLPAADEAADIVGWASVEHGHAVSGAWTYRCGTDVGIYAVETFPAWRRRGLAKRLMLHVLADAYRRGARTATLQSTRMGEPLYRALQFKPAGRYDEWVPCT